MTDAQAGDITHETAADEATLRQPDAPPEFGLAPRALDLWFLQSFIFAGFLLVAGVGGSVASGRYLAAAGAVLASGAALAAMILHARAYARRFRAVLLDDGLLLQRGVWWRSETFVPRARVQHTDVSQGPLGRQFGVATLKVFTAGSHLGQIQIDGLTREAATALRDALLGRGDRDGV